MHQKKSSLILTIIDTVCKRFRFNLVRKHCGTWIGSNPKSEFWQKQIGIPNVPFYSIVSFALHTITISSLIHTTQTFSINSKLFFLSALSPIWLLFSFDSIFFCCWLVFILFLNSISLYKFGKHQGEMKPGKREAKTY